MILPYRILAAGAALAAIFGAGWWVGAESVRDEWQAQNAADAIQASETARETERLARRGIDEVAHDTEARMAAARRDAGDARGELERLRLAASSAAGTCEPAAAAAAGPSASAADMVLADVLGRAAERSVELAGALDAAHAAGAGCERAYQAVIEAARGR